MKSKAKNRWRVVLREKDAREVIAHNCVTWRQGGDFLVLANEDASRTYVSILAISSIEEIHS